MSWSVELIGAAAGFLTTVAFLPQAIKMWRSKSVQDISLVSFSCMVLGVMTWMVYGILIGSWPVTIANAVTLCIQTPIVVMKLYYGRRCAAATE